MTTEYRGEMPQGEPTVDPLQKAANRFNGILLAQEYQPGGLISSLMDYQTVGFQKPGQAPDRLFAQLQLMAGQAASVAERNGDSQTTEQLRRMEQGFQAAQDNFRVPETQHVADMATGDSTPGSQDTPGRRGRGRGPKPAGPADTSGIRPSTRRAAG